MLHDEMIRYYRYLDENFSNVTLAEVGHTYEGRELVYLIVTSEENAGNLAEIQKQNALLADPRKVDGNASDLIETTPATAWMAYGIHGDELSSCDAAVFLAYQLVAGEDPVTEEIRNNVVTCIDPMENPDGRYDAKKFSYLFQGLRQRLIGPTEEPRVHEGLIA